MLSWWAWWCTRRAAALRPVRFAVGVHDELPALGEVLLDLCAKQVTVMATDRYRRQLCLTTTVTTTRARPAEAEQS